MNRQGKLSVLRNKNFARLFAAGATSIAGFAIGQTALTWVVWSNTRSPPDLALIGISFVLASVIFSLVAGALVDRHERRGLMVLSDLVRAGTLAALVVSMYLVGFSLVAIILVAFVLGSFTTLFQPAERALTPEVVGTEQLPSANALVQTSNSLLQFTAIATGAVIIGVVGVIAAFGLNALTFVVSAVLIVGITIPKATGAEETAEGAKRPSMIEDIREGFAYIVRNRALLELTVSAGIFNLFAAMVLQYIVVYTSVSLDGGVIEYGIVNGLFALGWAPGAYLSAHYRAERFAGKVWIYTGVLDGLCTIALVVFPVLPLAAAFSFILGLFLGLAVTTWLTAVQLIVPTEMQGRYFGLDQLGSFAVIPVGQVLGAFIIGVSNVSVDFLVGGIGAAASAGVFILSPYLRNLGWSQAQGVGPSPTSE